MQDICGAGGCILTGDLTLLLCPEGRSQPRQGRAKPLLNLQHNNFALFILFFCSFFFFFFPFPKRSCLSIVILAVAVADKQEQPLGHPAHCMVRAIVFMCRG